MEKGKSGKKWNKKHEKKENKKKRRCWYDLFGEGAEEDKEAKETIKKKIKNKIKKRKKKEIYNSHIILEVKEWEADQDLEALAKNIINTLKKIDCWNTWNKLEEVAFEGKKLIITFLVEDAAFKKIPIN